MNNSRKNGKATKSTCEYTGDMLMLNQKPETLPITFPKQKQRHKF